MFGFDYRVRLMNAVEQACHRHIGLYRSRVQACSAHPAVSYRYMVSCDVILYLSTITNAEAAQRLYRMDVGRLGAGELYKQVFETATGRSARPRDCMVLESLQNRLMDAC